MSAVRYAAYLIGPSGFVRGARGNARPYRDCSQRASFSPITSRPRCRRRWQIGGGLIARSFADTLTNEEANHAMAEFFRAKIREVVKDPAVAETLTPRDYPIGSKRMCVGTDYQANRLSTNLVCRSEIRCVRSAWTAVTSRRPTRPRAKRGGSKSWWGKACRELATARFSLLSIDWNRNRMSGWNDSWPNKAYSQRSPRRFSPMVVRRCAKHKVNSGHLVNRSSNGSLWPCERPSLRNPLRV